MKKNIPRCPLSSEESKAIWCRILREYELEPSSLLVLRHGLESLERLREVQVVIAKEGLQIPDRFKQLKAHPLLTIERDCRQLFIRAMRQLGLSWELPPAR